MALWCCQSRPEGVQSQELVVTQAYFIFSIGNIRPIITAEYPQCWKNYSECTKTLTQAPDYTQIIGVSHTKQNHICNFMFFSYIIGGLHN